MTRTPTLLDLRNSQGPRYSCRFLTSFGRFSAGYPTQGRGSIPCQQLGHPQVYLRANDFEVYVSWTDHKGFSTVSVWDYDNHRIQRRGHLLLVSVADQGLRILLWVTRLAQP